MKTIYNCQFLFKSKISNFCKINKKKYMCMICNIVTQDGFEYRLGKNKNTQYMSAMKI